LLRIGKEQSDAADALLSGLTVSRRRMKHSRAEGIACLDAPGGGDSSVPDGTIDDVCERAGRWRHEIVQARIKLADADLSSASRAELWQVVDCREWSLRVLGVDYPAELERIDREIEFELRR
jgi:hypothetical protein